MMEWFERKYKVCNKEEKGIDEEKYVKIDMKRNKKIVSVTTSKIRRDTETEEIGLSMNLCCRMNM